MLFNIQKPYIKRLPYTIVLVQKKSNVNPCKHFILMTGILYQEVFKLVRENEVYKIELQSRI